MVAAARVDPADPRGAVGAEFLLPDRDARFDFVDEATGGGEGLLAVRRARGADDGDLADAQRADAVDGGDLDARDVALDRDGDALELGAGHRRVGLVVEAGHRTALVPVSHDAQEDREAPRSRVRHVRDRLVDRERLAADVDQHRADYTPGLRGAAWSRSPRCHAPLLPPVFCSSPTSIVMPRSMPLSMS